MIGLPVRPQLAHREAMERKIEALTKNEEAWVATRLEMHRGFILQIL